MHRDIKPENFLITSKSLKLPGTAGGASMTTLKLGDFGLARELQNSGKLTEYVSTRWYRAPELVLKNRSYTKAIDVFAIGAIMGEMLLGHPLFPGKSESEQLTAIVSVLGTKKFEEWREGSNQAKQQGVAYPVG